MNYNVFDKLSLTYKIKEKATECVVDKQFYLPGPSKNGDTWFIKTHVIVLLLCTRFDTERKYLFSNYIWQTSIPVGLSRY